MEMVSIKSISQCLQARLVAVFSSLSKKTTPAEIQVRQHS